MGAFVRVGFFVAVLVFEGVRGIAVPDIDPIESMVPPTLTSGVSVVMELAVSVEMDSGSLGSVAVIPTSEGDRTGSAGAKSPPEQAAMIRGMNKIRKADAIFIFRLLLVDRINCMDQATVYFLIVSINVCNGTGLFK